MNAIRKYCETEDLQRGYRGRLQKAREDAFSENVLIVMGARGDLTSAGRAAALFSGRDLDLFSLAVTGGRGLPRCFENVPASAVASACARVRSYGYRKVGLLAVGRSAECALLSACHYEVPADYLAVSCVSDRVLSASDGKYRPKKGYAFVDGGVPFACVEIDGKKTANDPAVPDEYIAAAPEETVIPVQRIGVPLLILSCRRDPYLNSVLAGERMLSRCRGDAMQVRFTVGDGEVVPSTRGEKRDEYGRKTNEKEKRAGAAYEIVKSVLRFGKGLYVPASDMYAETVFRVAEESPDRSEI